MKSGAPLLGLAKSIYYMNILLQTVLMQYEKIYSQFISKVHTTSNEHDSFTQNYTLSDIFRTFCNFLTGNFNLRLLKQTSLGELIYFSIHFK